MAMLNGTSALVGLAMATALSLGYAAAQEGPKADVIHIWVSAGESAAINEIVKRYEAAGGVWLDSAVAGGQNLVPAVMSRITGGNPPTAYQALAGRAFEDLWEQGLLNDIEATATADNWRAVLPAPLVKIMENKEGKIFLIPFGMHGPNWIWYSTEVLKKSGVTEVPTNFDESFFEALDKVKAAGFNAFVVGKQSFQERFLMETVMLALGGKDYWNGIFGGRDDSLVRSDMTRKVFETFRRLSTYADEGAAGRTWPVNTNLLITNQGGFNVMGDWAKGEFTAAGKVAEVDYGCILPGDKPWFLLQADMMAVPAGPEPDRAEAQNLLAHVTMQPDAQVAFNLNKGSLPPRTDVPRDQFDACAQKGFASYTDPDLTVATVNMFFTPKDAGLWEDLVSEFFNNPDLSVDEAIERLSTIVKEAD
jgi:glucose/mannose transport system substrate-binding protein